MRRHNQRIEESLLYPTETQERVLREILSRAAQTEIAVQYGFQDLKSGAAFRDRLPLHQYADLKPYIDRMREGEKDVLWPGQVQWYAKSSGTSTGKSKFLPITPEALESCHFSGGRFELALYTKQNPKTKLFEGQALRLGGSTAVESNGKSFHGDLSAIMIEHLPVWAELRSAPKHQTALMKNWEEKIEAIADEAIATRITSLWGVSSWFLVLAHRILEKTGAENLLEVWPNLELFAHGGVNFTPYESQFRALMPGPQVTFMENYNASEGFFAVQDQRDQPGMLLLLDNGIYYEFIPMDRYAGEHSPTVSLSEVELEVEYALVITTNAGLWRYILGDTIKFISLAPHRIIVSGRTGHFINAFGEELIVSDAENALAKACELHSCTIADFHAAPIFLEGKKSGRHQWLIEFEQRPQDPLAFAQSLDALIREENSDYDAKRTGNLILNQLSLIIAPTGLFHLWLESKGKLGGQHKIPRLRNDRDLMQEFLSLLPKDV